MYQQLSAPTGFRNLSGLITQTAGNYRLFSGQTGMVKRTIVGLKP